MKTKDNKINNCIYASFYHLELIILPIIIKHIENESKSIEIISQYNLETSIKDIFERINLRSERKNKLQNIKWNNNKHKEKENQVIFIIGSKKYIQTWNNKLEGKEIYNCYYYEDIKDEIEQFKNNIINTMTIY